MYANVVVEISHENLDRTFQYLVPDSLLGKVKVGSAVQIPFGKGNRLISGFVIELTEVASFDPEKMKAIQGVITGKVSVEERQIALASFLKKEYGSTMIQALKTVLPVKRSVKKLEEREVSLRIPREEALALYQETVRKKQNARARLLKELLETDSLPQKLITEKLAVSSNVIQTLEEKGVLRVDVKRVYRSPFKSECESAVRPQLSKEQSAIISSVKEDFDNGIRQTYVIRGITGSGKTEVYMSLIEEMVARKKQCIMLIPEIALTYQTAKRFYERFGDKVGIMNSTLSDGEKFDQMERAKRGEIAVMIGPRSALFTPFSDIGLIVMDEEHENSYKSEVMPRYHARETALELARLCNASVILGSATPSLEAMYRVNQGKYKEFTLTERLTGGELPQVEIVDLREELRNGNRSIFSLRLQELMQDRLERNEQIMLFLNRRGYAGFISCRACGKIMKCPHCDVSLSEHQGGVLVCHYCGYTTRSVTICPECGSKYISGFRAGTEQIEEKIKKMFPSARVVRMDADTTKSKDSYEEILSSFANKEADILIGTQMIVKGHDFPDVTLMGILAADLSLGASDYHSAERTFQLLTQAAGRARRGEKPGNVVIQTYQPDHYAILHAANQDYMGFYEEEIAYRDLMDYPPVQHLLSVLIQGRDEEQTKSSAEAMVEALKKQFMGARIVGPAPAGIGKINDRFRFQFFIKSQDEELLSQMKNTINTWVTKQEGNESILFDYDPMNLF